MDLEAVVYGPKTRFLNSVTCDNGVVRFLVMSKLEVSLEQYAAQQETGRLSADLVLEIGIQLFNHLEQMHALEIVHGNIHSGNIFFASEETTDVLLTDFAAAQYPEPPHSGSAAPQQSFRDDVLAVFVTLVELGRGRDSGPSDHELSDFIPTSWLFDVPNYNRIRQLLPELSFV